MKVASFLKKIFASVIAIYTILLVIMLVFAQAVFAQADSAITVQIDRTIRTVPLNPSGDLLPSPLLPSPLSSSPLASESLTATALSAI